MNACQCKKRFTDSAFEAVDQITNLPQGKDTDRGCECVGYQCCDKHDHEANHLTMNNLVASSKETVGRGVECEFANRCCFD